VLCCLKQAVDNLDETVGPKGLRSGSNAIEMSEDQSHDSLHGLGFGAHDVRAPLMLHLGYDVSLLALDSVSQLLAVQPCLNHATGRGVSDDVELIEGNPRFGEMFVDTLDESR
jgi:hypothetical protein